MWQKILEVDEGRGTKLECIVRSPSLVSWVKSLVCSSFLTLFHLDVLYPDTPCMPYMHTLTPLNHPNVGIYMECLGYVGRVVDLFCSDNPLFPISGLSALDIIPRATKEVPFGALRLQSNNPNYNPWNYRFRSGQLHHWKTTLLYKQGFVPLPCEFQGEYVYAPPTCAADECSQHLTIRRLEPLPTWNRSIAMRLHMMIPHDIRTREWEGLTKG